MKSKYLLVLFLLIAIWAAALVFMGVRYMLTASGKKADSATAREVVEAVQKFREAHEGFPLGNGERFDADLETDLTFMQILSREGESGPAFTISGRTDIKDGALVDKYGKPFRVRVDTSRDGKVYNPLNNELVEAQVVVWSAGKDGLFETWSDNGRSWD